MPRPEAERLAESLWPQLRPLIVGVLDSALAGRDDPASRPDGEDPRDAEVRYVEERATTQVARYLGKAAHRRKATP